jgi:hypothetical protein
VRSVHSSETEAKRRHFQFEVITTRLCSAASSFLRFISLAADSNGSRFNGSED